MKICILANYDVGLYQFRRELIEALLMEHEVVISLPYGYLVEPLREAGCRFEDTPLDRRGINPVRDFKLFLSYIRLLKKEKPDIVITYTIKPNIYGGMVCRLLRIPYAANITGLGTAFQNPGLLRSFVTVLYKLALKKAKTVFFENQGNMETLLGARIVRKEQCCLLPGAGVNLEHYPYTSFPTEQEPVRFLFMGRVMREKGIDELFLAMDRLYDEGIPCVLDVLGHYEEDYEDMIRRYESKGWLFYHGYQTDVRPFIANCHCFVLPSWHEGMANTNLESAAMGRPLITSNIHGCKEAAIPDVSGLLCEVQDPESLYECMEKLCRMTNEQREGMGKAGRRHMEDVFDKITVVKKTMDALNL